MEKIFAYIVLAFVVGVIFYTLKLPDINKHNPI